MRLVSRQDGTLAIDAAGRRGRTSPGRWANSQICLISALMFAAESGFRKSYPLAGRLGR